MARGISDHAEMAKFEGQPLATEAAWPAAEATDATGDDGTPIPAEQRLIGWVLDKPAAYAMLR